MAAPRFVELAARACFRAIARPRVGGREAYAEQMAATFDTLLADATARGTFAVIRLLASEIGGLVARPHPAPPPPVSRSPLMRNIGQDVRFAWRTFRRRPVFTAAIVVTLALGIGANAAIFSVTKAVLLERLPYTDPSRLVMVWEDESALGFPRNTPAPGNCADWASSIQSFDGVAAIDTADFNLAGEGEPEKIGGARATASLFSVLGVQPMLGRVWRPDEDRPGNRLAVLNYSVWVRSFGRDASVVGRTVDFNGAPYTVIGVMPEGFEFNDPALEIWTPLSFSAAELADRGDHYLMAVARLRPGVSLAQTNAELTALADRLKREQPATNQRVGMYAVPLLDDYVGDTGPALVALLVAVGCVLLIACVNVANLLMTQAAGRAKEMAVRTALGADRRRLVRQLLTESVLLSVAGGVLGILVSLPSFALLERMVPPAMHGLSHVRLDPIVLAATAALSIATGILFGMAPAWRTSQVATRPPGRGVIGAGHRLRTTLVVVEVAVATVLLVAAGLLAQSFKSARGVTLGFRPSNVLTVRIQLPRRVYADAVARTQFVDTVLERVRALPGVAMAGYTSATPLTWKGGTSGFVVEGVPRDRSMAYDAANRTISPGYMETTGMALVRGRFFDARDRVDGAPVAIINETMARQYWSGIDPVGRRMHFGPQASPWRTIVGVVGDTKVMGIERPSKAEMYFPIAQAADNWMWPRDLAVRATGDPLALVQSVSQAVWSVDRRQPVSNIETMDELVAKEMQDRRVQTTLFGVFATLALFLAAVGIYGVLSYAVTERTAEIGVRLALGGQPRGIRVMFVRRGLTVALAGLSIGLVFAFWGTKLLDRLLFQVAARDLGIFTIQAGVLALVCALAAYLPARRASKVDPMTALRTE